MAAKDTLGQRGERIAERHIVAAGFSIVDRNWRCGKGEIDLVARLGSEYVFVEVKTRSGVGYGHPFEAITPTKLARLRRLAFAWCAEHDVEGCSIRIDAVAVLLPPGGPTEVEHLEGVF